MAAVIFKTLAFVVTHPCRKGRVKDGAPRLVVGIEEAKNKSGFEIALVVEIGDQIGNVVVLFRESN
jgi:hypothetical protein